MNIEALAQCLRPWMQVRTWNSGHPLDEERFHVALHRCFAEHGVAISGGDFEEAMQVLASELHPDWSAAHRDETVNEYARNAERIGSYLYDTQRL